MPKGQPVKMTQKVIEQIAEAFLYGFTDEETATLAGIDQRTIRRYRAGESCPQIKKAEAARKAEYIRRITEGTRPDWARWAWFLERRFPLQFSKPEIQLSVNTQVTNNSLVISAEVAGEIVSRSKAAKAKVVELFNERRPINGNGHTPEATE
jgi:hypothetical protein